MGLIADIQRDVAAVRGMLESRTTMAGKKRKIPKLTAEEIAEREANQRMARERIAYRRRVEAEEARRAARGATPSE
jgi:hypothetical protein